MITPSTETYAIWGIIYIFQFCFTIYQVLPSSIALNRNDNLIYGQIGCKYTILMSCQCLYFIIWQFSNATAFLMSTMMVLIMFITSLVILQYSQYEKMNSFEFYFLRIGFSISTSWMLLETFVSIFYVVKAASYYGTHEVQTTATESSNTVFTLWFLFVIYNTCGYIQFNPLFGVVFIWSLLGIRYRNKDNHDFENIYKHTDLILKVYTFTWIGQVILFSFNISWAG